METEVLTDPEAVARRAASVIAEAARLAARERGRFLLAVSGGTTPWRMLELFAKEDVPWPLVHLFQVDERVARAGDPARNSTSLREALLDKVLLPEGQIHLMPVEDVDLSAAAASYAKTLRRIAGTPPTLDLVHLGLGADGHTASLVPGDPALDARDCEVAVTGPYQGYRRMTLGYPMMERARLVLWIVIGADKAAALQRLRRGDRSIPAGRISPRRALLLADTAAAGAPTEHRPGAR